MRARQPVLANSRSSSQESATVVKRKIYYKTDKFTPRKYTEFSYSNRRIPDHFKRILLADLASNLKQYRSPQIPSQHFADIYSVWKSRQFRTIIDSKYLENITVVDENSRVLGPYSQKRYKQMEKFCTIHHHLQRKNSIWLCVFLFDKLNQMVCRKSKRSTVSIHDIHLNTFTALFVSGKYCQIYAENLDELKILIGGNVEDNSVYEREMEIFEELKWNLNHVSEWEFFQLFSYFGNMSEKQFELCWYLLRVGLCYLELVEEKPVIKAAAVVAIVAKSTDKQELLQLHNLVGAMTEIRSQDLIRVARIYSRIFLKQAKRPGAVSDMFSQEQYSSVSRQKLKLHYL